MRLDDARLAPLVAEQLRQRGAQPDERLPALCGLFKDRCDTTVALADWLMPYHGDVTPAADELAKHLTEAVRPATVTFAARLQTIDWTAEAIAAALKQTLAEHGLKGLVVWALEENDNALAFYAGAGGRDIAEGVEIFDHKALKKIAFVWD